MSGLPKDRPKVKLPLRIPDQQGRVETVSWWLFFAFGLTFDVNRSDDGAIVLPLEVQLRPIGILWGFLSSLCAATYVAYGYQNLMAFSCHES